ncbi:MAG: nucleotidyltransferase family protein, partial [Bryobacterales bacterium]|nr:nucleotidyltransferase family protein [Bryobacterales bacterium]
MGESRSVLPALKNRLGQVGLTLDKAAGSDLAARCRRAFALSASVADQGAKLCSHLERSGIQAVLFKGLSSIAHLYAGPQERTVKDADILIREQDLKAAVRALESLGLRAGHGGNLEAYVAAVRSMPGFSGNESLAMDAEPFERLDLHWRLGRRPVEEMQVERIMSRAVRKKLLGTEVSVVAPADGLMLSAHHAMRNQFTPDEMIRDVLDTRRWLDLLESRGELQSALDHVERCRLRPAVFGLALLAGREASASQLASAEGRELAGLFELQMREGPVAKDLAHLSDFRAMRQIAGAVATNWRQYRTYLSAFEV